MKKNKRHYAVDFGRTIYRLDKHPELLEYQENIPHEGTMPDKNPYKAKVKITTDEVLGHNEKGEAVFKTIYTENGKEMYDTFIKTYNELMNANDGVNESRETTESNTEESG